MIGTLRPNQGAPALVREFDVPLKSSAFFRNENVLIVKAADKKASGKKIIHFIDTANSASTNEVSRRVTRGGQEAYSKSVTSSLYTEGTGGVNNRDSAMHPYKLEKKSFKLFQKLGFRFIQILSYNAWIVYSKSGGSNDYLLFLNDLIIDFVLKTGEGRVIGPSGGRQRILKPRNVHAPKRLAARENRPRPIKKCRVCRKKGIRRENVFYCPNCNSDPALCASPCSGEWEAHCLFDEDDSS